jgi:hypothetical protein
MIKKSLVYVILGITLILSVSLSGCVAPPVEKPVTPVDNYDPNQFATTETTTHDGSGYVTEVTPFETARPVDTKLTYQILPPVTQAPQDIRCRIYTKTQTYAYNGSAFTFNLKNPPMLINYTVIPTNYTYKKVVTSRRGDKAESVRTIDTYSPNS